MSPAPKGRKPGKSATKKSSKSGKPKPSKSKSDEAPNKPLDGRPSKNYNKKNKPFDSVFQRQRKQPPPPPPPPRKDSGEEVLAKLKSGEITKIKRLPKIGPEVCARIPPPVDFDKIYSIDDKMKHLELENTVKVDEDCEVRSDEKPKEYTKEELLELNMKRWKKVKVDWISHTNEYNKRYDVNRQILEHLFKKPKQM